MAHSSTTPPRGGRLESVGAFFDPAAELVARLGAGGFEPRDAGPDAWESRCPGHNGSRHNLSIARGDDGCALVHCHHDDPGAAPCTPAAIIAPLGLLVADLFPPGTRRASRPRRDRATTHNTTTQASEKTEGKAGNGKKRKTYPDPETAVSRWAWSANKTEQEKAATDGRPARTATTAVWMYRDRDGSEVMAVGRLSWSDGDKDFRPYHRVADGWQVGDPPGPLPLFKLPELVRDAGDLIVVCEGEKTANTARWLGLQATTSAHGAKSPQKSDWSPLAGKRVVILPDADGPGEGYAVAVSRLLAKLDPAPQVQVLRLETIWKTDAPLPEGGDLFDWYATHGTTPPFEGRPDPELQTLLREAIADAPDFVLPQAATAGDRPTEGPSDGGTWPLTELGNAHRLIHYHADDMRHCHPWDTWLVWDGRRWSEDDRGRAMEIAGKNTNTILFDLDHTIDDEDRTEIVNWWRSSQNKRRIESSLFLAGCQQNIPILPGELDSNQWMFNCLNGTIDLKTGELRPHSRADLITKLCPVEYDPTATCPLWESVLRTVFARPDEADRDDLVSYWQRVCGTALVGVIRDHVLPVAWGSGSNGKSTIMNALLDTFGTDYAMKAPPALLMSKKNDSHPTELASLFGKRLVIAIETEQGRRLNETTVKELTGGDPITARRMREDFWTFQPTHTLLMATNHLPKIKGTDHGIWRRVKLVPFTVTIKDGEADPALPEKLRSELPGILAWCVRGCLQWQAIGLQAPPEVLKATQDYRDGEDLLRVFLDERCLIHPEVRSQAGELYKSYQSWCEDSGERPMTLTEFGKAITERGIQKSKRNGRQWYMGIGLKSDPDPDAPPV